MDKVDDTWAELQRLLGLEFEQNAIKDLERLVSQTSDMQQPPGMLDRIKSNLGSHEDLNAQIEVATEQYNIAVCQQLAVGLVKLPRELRDLVYQNLVPEELLICTSHECDNKPHVDDPASEADHEVEAYKAYGIVPVCTKVDSVCQEHFWRDKALGVNLLHELKESFYRYPTFSMATYVDSSVDRVAATGLRSLLNCDRFCVGLEPKDLITNFTWINWIQDPTSDYSGLNSCAANVENLFQLNKRTHIRIVLAMHMFHFSIQGELDILDAYMKCVLPVLVRLRRAGYPLKVELSHFFHSQEAKDAFPEWMRRLEFEVEKIN